MDTFWGVLGAFAVIVVPLLLAGWLIRRGDAAQRRSRRPKPPARSVH